MFDYYDGDIKVNVSDYDTRGWAKFNLSGVDSSARFKTVTLHLYMEDVTKRQNTRARLVKTDPQKFVSSWDYSMDFVYFDPGSGGWTYADYPATFMQYFNSQISSGAGYITIYFYGC